MRAGVEVRALIGAGKLRELHRDASARYECWPCGKAGRTAQPTSVIVPAHWAFRVVKLAHAGRAEVYLTLIATTPLTGRTLLWVPAPSALAVPGQADPA